MSRAIDDLKRHGGKSADDFRRVAREHEAARRDGSTDPDFYEGVAATHRLFIAALHEAGAEPVESVGRPFDPAVHEAVATVPSDGMEPGTVAREMRHR